jgi:hypothetical protein
MRCVPFAQKHTSRGIATVLGEQRRPKDCSARSEVFRNEQPLDVEAEALEAGAELPATEGPRAAAVRDLLPPVRASAAAMERLSSSARGSSAGGVRASASGTMPDDPLPSLPTRHVRSGTECTEGLESRSV